MTTKLTMADLLRWRLAQVEKDAPPAPRAGRLLAMARPWWETYPEKFLAVVQQLGALQVGYGHAMVDSGVSAHVAAVVPAVVVVGEEIKETCVQPLYFDVTDSTLRLRFELDLRLASPSAVLEVTFVAGKDLQPMFAAAARASMNNEYFLETVVPDKIGREWETLKVTSPMPFRLLLRLVDEND